MLPALSFGYFRISLMYARVSLSDLGDNSFYDVCGHFLDKVDGIVQKKLVHYGFKL